MKKMKIVIGVIFIILGLIVIYENINYSPVKNMFQQKRERILKDKNIKELETFSERELKDYPKALRKYFEVCGFIGKSKMTGSVAKYEDVKFILNAHQKPLKISYERINDGLQPNVLAFIDTNIYGIPFQGIDSYYKNEGSMKGVLGKAFTIFDESGKDFYIGSLVTYLSECLLVPTAALQDFITWREIDEQTLEAKIEYSGYEVEGIFYFNGIGEFERFTTNDRIAIDSSGMKTKAPWSAIVDDYVTENGMKHPKHLQAIWHYDDGDSIYFDGEMKSLTYHYN
ncbi:DUF6544 family protein [Candidatus Enterococcus murrayae]|uniref:Uncharacterized protein n=1 Tax=Candidatus Enterococcus murrayae TaxID=2815321 RepID=A0ABS3HMG1_9ENTE|nr:DUF6544 family protein [Enterococcus sp. MJM16]MBO0454646.1 hypothetical protein [Enterococcus sp. MJM16]